MPPPTDADYTELVHACWPGLYRTAYLLLGDAAEAEDLVQTALAKTYASWSKVRDLEAAEKREAMSKADATVVLAAAEERASVLQGKLDAELAYITGGMSWEADYNVLAPEKSDLLEITGADLAAVDASSLMVHPDSGQVRD